MLQRLAFSAARQAKAIGSALRDATHTHRAFSTQLDFVDIDQSTRGDEVREFVAEPRVVDGSRACAELRKQGYVPGIVYGKDAAGQDRRLLVQLPQNQLQRELNDVGRAIENTIYKIKVADEEFSVIPRNLQRHPTKDMPNSVNFLCHDPSRKLKVQIPLEFFNVEKCTGLRQGGACCDCSLLIPVAGRHSRGYLGNIFW